MHSLGWVLPSNAPSPLRCVKVRQRLDQVGGPRWPFCATSMEYGVLHTGSLRLLKVISTSTGRPDSDATVGGAMPWMLLLAAEPQIPDQALKQGFGLPFVRAAKAAMCHLSPPFPWMRFPPNQANEPSSNTPYLKITAGSWSFPRWPGDGNGL